MKKTLMVVAALAASFVIAGEREPLWPEGNIPDFWDGRQIAAPWEEADKPGFDRATHQMPYLEWDEKPANPNGACMILISGGGYDCTCDRPAFRPLEKMLLDNGITCVWLWYRTPRPFGLNLPIYQSGWDDGQRAVRLVRAAAKKRGFDPERIGVLGCSAGSHLSVLLATSALTPAYRKVDAVDDIPCHINWAIPMCPAYALTDGLTDKNKSNGDAPDVKLNPCFKFDAKTCPMCFFHGGTDPYSPNGSTQIYRQLRRMKIPAELHLDADRGHGPVDGKKFERAIEFMRQMGYLGKVPNETGIDRRFMPTHTKRTEKEMLWPNGKIPGQAFADRSNLSKVDDAMQVEEPYLVWYVPEKLTTKAIQIVFPGGGYTICNYNGEGTPIAYYLNGKGMTTVVVMYRCPRPKGQPKHYLAWIDAQRAIRLVRSEAAARGLDPDRIGVMGFSAGGHLTLMTATNGKANAYEPVDDIDKLSCAVQWACPTYPAYALTDGVDWQNTTGGNDDSATLLPELAFDEATPPMCFQHGDADGWAAMNSVKCWEQLRRMGRSSDLHTYATRNHCFQMRAAPGTGSWTWLDRIWDFLEHKGLNR